MPHPLFETVRQRFHRACGYCGVTETAVGGELTLDHYQPRAAGGGDDQDNLVYACVRCNQYKGDFWPDDDGLARGRRVLHPGIDDILLHAVEDENTGYVQGLTSTGVFHITLLHLNRPPLVEHRLAGRLQNFRLAPASGVLTMPSNRVTRTPSLVGLAGASLAKVNSTFGGTVYTLPSTVALV